MAEGQDIAQKEGGPYATGGHVAGVPVEGEGRRERVRRVLFDPLADLGFRRPGGMTVERQRQIQDRLADDLSYMDDAALVTLRDMLKAKGEGAARNVWPSAATVYALAELVQPRPFEEIPGLLRWFRSVEGPRAMAAGTLVETWGYFHRFKRPPIMAGRQLAERAAENRRRLALIAEKAAVGLASDDDLRWSEGYQRRLDYCRAMVLGNEKGAGNAV